MVNAAVYSSEYVVALFDVLGFSNRLKRDGLREIASQYSKLVALADEHNARVDDVFGTIGFKESAYWAAEGEIAIFQKVGCAYASDSLLVWAHAAFPEARNKTVAERAELARDRKLGWQYLPVPCDSFLALCNEFICHGIEIGLPLRGAIGMGDCILDKPSGIYLGLPLVENAELEKAQEWIGASFCKSFLKQTIPERFKRESSEHLKINALGNQHFGGVALDWPLHWRRTRATSETSEIERLANGAGSAAKYYENTLRFIDASHVSPHRQEFEGIRSVYRQFSYPEVACSAGAVRKATVKNTRL